MDEQFASIQATLASLTAPPSVPPPAKPSAQPTPKPMPPPRAPPKVSASVPKAPKPTPVPTPSPSYASAACKLVRPSLIMTRKHTDEMAPLAIRHSPSAVCAHLNTALATAHPEVTLSTARWTKNNLVVIAGPDTTAHHLTASSHFISDTLSTFLSTSADTPLPVSAKENESPPPAGPTPLKSARTHSHATTQSTSPCNWLDFPLGSSVPTVMPPAPQAAWS
ncbi:hypothetical protein EDB92DRAFT_1819558 [Lactarius akahatsu]|uniref:Uncharacterized protein n=1 Tax=Lactarius akahatsu TaxID=416441 RepID=A0AAD4L9F7_9AGAM|nr:hypothetical protein EDB92DRAFT_1819558 [Lactarius akahatsu]